MVSSVSAPPLPRTRRAAPQLPFGPFTDFSASAQHMEEFAAQLWLDRKRNLTRRFTYFGRQNPDATVARMGFVPLVIQHGFATLSLSRSRGPSAVCTVGWYYTYGVPDVILIDSRWRVELELGHALEQAGRLLRRRSERDLRLNPKRVVGKAVRRAMQWGAQPLKTLGTATDADLDLHAYGFGSYFYRHYMDRLDVPLLVGHTGPKGLTLPRFR